MAAAFELLTPKLRSLLEAEGLREPTAPQREAIPRILAGEDVLVIAPTGAGKTEAALLPILDALAARDRVGIGALYITPLRALNRDVERRIGAWAGKLDLRVEVRHGDTPQNQRRKQAAKPPDLLVTTPETLQAILPARVMRKHLASVRWVVIDEVHQLAKDRRGIQLALGLERLAELAEFQRIALSATVGNPQEVAALFGGARPLRVVHASAPKRMEFHVEWPKPNDGDFELSRELFISPEVASVLTLLRDEIEAHQASLVFVNSRTNAELLGSRLPMVTEGVQVHHGSLPRDVRERAEHDLKAGRAKALVCTSTLELGIDVGRVDHTLQYQSPRQVASLIQRVGRSGHDLERTSKGTLVVNSADDVLESLAVIGEARAARLEPLPIHRGSLDVLGHQLVGMALDEQGRVPRERALGLVKRAEPYRSLEEAAFDKVADYLVHLRFMRREGDLLVATGRAREYYFRNLSTIRDERTYPVIDLTSMKPVGILGEEEMMLRARKGYHFVIRGRTWNIVNVGPDGSVYVNPIQDPTARIPGWQGEIIPVHWQVAQAMARLREDLAGRLRAASTEQVAEALAPEWPANRSALRRVGEQVAQHLQTGAPMPGAGNLVIEGFERWLVIHAPFGELVNEVLADLVEEKLAARNLIRFWWTDAYRIMVELLVDTRDLDLDALARDLFVVQEQEVEGLLETFLSDHLPLGFYLKGVAERFGAIPRGLYIGSDDMQSFEVRFKHTPVEDEALREVLTEHVDFPHVREVYRRVREGDLALQVWKGSKPTPLAYHIVRRYLEVPEALSPEADREQSMQRMRQFLRTERVTLLCFQCGTMVQGHVVGDLPERPVCAQCEGPVLGVLSWHGTPVKEALERHQRGEELPEEEAKELTRTRQGADLVAVYGKKAVLALSVYGVGPQAAAKILAKMHHHDDDFFRDLYDAKLRYVMTRPFWDRQGSGRMRELVAKPSAYSQREGASTERRL